MINNKTNWFSFFADIIPPKTKYYFLEPFPNRSNMSIQRQVKRTKIVQSEPDPAVVFFPTNQDSECMDATTGIVETKIIC